MLMPPFSFDISFARAATLMMLIVATTRHMLLIYSLAPLLMLMFRRRHCYATTPLLSPDYGAAVTQPLLIRRLISLSPRRRACWYVACRLCCRYALRYYCLSLIDFRLRCYY